MAAPGRGLAQPSEEGNSQIREFEHMASRALGGDLVYALYLPPGYAAGEARYPTLYLLHGLDGNHLEWLHTGYLRQTLDGLIAQHRVEPMIVVMPDGGNSWYVDSKDVGGPGDYDTAIGAELVAAIDQAFRTKPGPRNRGIGGLSMGGFGALRLAFQKPFRFAAAAAFSGALWTRLSSETVPRDRLNTIFNGAFGRPFQIDRFLAQSPLKMAEGLIGEAKAPAVFLTVGDDDRFKLYLDTFRLFERMRQDGLSVEMRMTEGDHEWETWAAELPEALLFFDRQFRRGE
ncbi:MAG: prolyl oligopeptidase family serine peptidase [Alphaproteobacteria bacterium]|nr:prolyl oligopeptidase family serine peptidase [Alphaproteobacteria bacterium]